MVPVYLLDTDLPENSAWHRTLTHWLYGGDAHYRLCQEVVLGMGGVKMLRALGHHGLQRFHMNEGHASLLPLALLDEQAVRSGHSSFTREDIEEVRRQCVFTTHTPVPAGHDQFPADLVNRVLGRTDVAATKDVLRWENYLNMTYLALNLSHYVNGVAKKHARCCARCSRSIASTRSRTVSMRRRGPASRSGAVRPPHAWMARGELHPTLRVEHSAPGRMGGARQGKRQLIEHVNRVTNAGMEVRDLTIGFARRDATYKRGDLVFRDLDRLKHIAATGGRVQIIYAGKAHPHDQGGKEVIKRIFEAQDALKTHVKIAYMVNYDWQLAQLMTGRRRRVAEHAEPPLGGLRYQRYEGGPERRAEPQHPRRVVDRRLHRRRHGLGHRRIAGSRRRRRGPVTARRRRALRQAGAGGRSALLPRAASDSSTSCDTPSRSTAPFSTRSAWCWNTSRRPIFAEKSAPRAPQSWSVGARGLGQFP
jgi:starch phosphorylase